jgi:hypothetical protein
MDIAASGLGIKIKNYLPGKSQFVLAAVATVIVLLILLVAQVIFDTPRPILVLLGGTFLVWTAVYWFLNRHVQKKPLKHLARWFLPWLAAIVLFLGAVYFIDRGGWLWYRVTGYNVTLAEDYQQAVNISLDEFVGEHPQFELDAAGLRLPQGEHIFTETVIVPQGTALTIDPGTVLHFAAGRSLISYSPVWAQGTEEKPIRFTAQNPWLKWGVMGVVGSSTSVFEHIQLEHSRQALINDIDFFAGLSLIEADGVIRNSTFENVFGKDAVNARLSDVLIEDNVFRNAYKDCLDLDGGSGEVSRNHFVDCDDEGIDLSDNKAVDVYGNTILDIRGGRLAADQNQAAIEAQNSFGYSNDGE